MMFQKPETEMICEMDPVVRVSIVGSLASFSAEDKGNAGHLKSLLVLSFVVGSEY